MVGANRREEINANVVDINVVCPKSLRDCPVEMPTPPLVTNYRPTSGAEMMSRRGSLRLQSSQRYTACVQEAMPPSPLQPFLPLMEEGVEMTGFESAIIFIDRS